MLSRTRIFTAVSLALYQSGSFSRLQSACRNCFPPSKPAAATPVTSTQAQDIARAVLGKNTPSERRLAATQAVTRQQINPAQQDAIINAACAAADATTASVRTVQAAILAA